MQHVHVLIKSLLLAIMVMDSQGSVIKVIYSNIFCEHYAY